MRWADPSGPGTAPRENSSVASQTDSATPASTSDVSTCWPSPVRSRAWSAARMPQAAKRPAPRSVSGTPTFTGGRIRLAGHRHQPGHALRHQVEPALVRRRAGLAVARDRGVDDARVQGVQRAVIETQPAQGAGAIILDEHVRARRQPPQYVRTAGSLQIDHDAALSAIDRIEGRTVAAARAGHAARRVALRRLDLDHVGAHVAQ